MADITRSQIVGTITGFTGHSTFKLFNGQLWQQYEFYIEYYSSNSPIVTITLEDGKYMMMIEGMKRPVQVVQVYTISEGRIVSPFTGFDYKRQYEFHSGEVWEQTESKYVYHEAYQPYGIIIDGPNGYELTVEDVSESVKVQRVSE